MRIGIVGAGAIGGWIGVMLASHGHEVSVLARGATLEALRAQSWKLTDKSGVIEAEVRASSHAADLGLQDIVVIALKGPALLAATATVAELVGPETIVIPAMNGVPWWFLLNGAGDLPPATLKSIDPDNAIARALPLERVIGCVVHASASSPSPGVVAHNSGRKLIFGEPDGKLSARLEHVSALFERSGFEIARSARIQRDIWYKLWGNMTMNPISALTGATCDRILDDDLVTDFVLRVMTEAQNLGKQIGCDIPESGRDRIALTRKLGAFKTSMLQDAEAARPLEIDQLLAAPREIAQMLLMPTPNMDALLGLTRLFARTRRIY